MLLALQAVDAYDLGFVQPKQFVLTEGESILFRYDEGTPTELVFTVDRYALKVLPCSICPPPL